MRRTALGALGLALTLACGSDDGMAEGGEDSSSDTEGEAPIRPIFSEPASGRLSLVATRTEDLVLAVQNVEPGRTDLVIDGRSLGPLVGGSGAGTLDGEALTLRLRGAMVSGSHHMLLRTNRASGVSESEMIEVAIAAELEVMPVATTATPSELEGTRVLAFGEGSDALLIALHEHALGPRLHLVPRGELGWDVAGTRTVLAPELVLGPDERALPVAALRYGRTEDDAGRVRVAFRAGPSGERIDLLDVPWDAAMPPVGLDPGPQTSLLAIDALAGRPAEWAQLGRPWLMADLVLAELWAPLDVESERPGDRALVWSRVHANGRGLDPAQRVSVRADLVDLDRLGPALDRLSAAASGPAIFSIRADQHQPLVLEHDPAGGVRVRPTVIDPRERTFSYVTLPLATVVGAFGSRSVAGVTAIASGRARMALMDDLGEGGVAETSLSDDDLPAFDQVTGELAPTSVHGVIVFLVPYGPELPVHAIYSSGANVHVTPLTELRCDSVAVAATPDAGGVVPLACAVDGIVHLGALDTSLGT